MPVTELQHNHQPLPIEIMTIKKGTQSLPDGTTIRYEIHGSEHSSTVPIVLINGWTSTKEDFQPLTSELAKKRTVLVYDRRGIGESRLAKRKDDEEEPDHTLDLEANDVLDLLSALGGQFLKVNILGWSMGGHILQALMLLPEVKVQKEGIEVKGVHVQKAILASTMPKLPKGDLKQSDLQHFLSQAGTNPKWKDELTEFLMSYQYDENWMKEKGNKPTFEERVKVSLTTRRPQSIIGSQMLAIQGRDTREELHKISESLPVLIIHGKLDRMVKYSESDSFTKSIKSAKRLDMQPNNDQFGHFWFDYFGKEFWANKIENYLQNGHSSTKSKL